MRYSTVRIVIPAVIPSRSARHFSVRAGTPGNICPLDREVFFGLNQSFGLQLPLKMRGLHRSEPKSRAVFTYMAVMRFSVRAGRPTNLCLVKSGSFSGQNRSSGRSLPLRMRGTLRSTPNLRAIFVSRNAGLFSVGTGVPGNVYLLKCEVLLGRSQSFGRYL